MRHLAVSLLCAIIVPACRAAPEATSLLGEPLYAPRLSGPELSSRKRQLADAQARLDRDPAEEENWIWVGRRLAYLGRYREAIAVYGEALLRFPESPRLLRHRGHRSITIRRLDDALSDLSRAAVLIEGAPDEIEPDGQPNAMNVPTGTTQTNIYYHLGLVHYLRGDFERALPAYRLCLDRSTNDDMRCAATYWLYLTLRRLGRDAEAGAAIEPITPDAQIIENFAYHRLLLLYKGELTAGAVLSEGRPESPVGAVIDDATIGYGLGAWHLVNGRTETADRIFRRIVMEPGWAAFGHIAAESELARGLREPFLRPPARARGRTSSRRKGSGSLTSDKLPSAPAASSGHRPTRGRRCRHRTGPARPTGRRGRTGPRRPRRRRRRPRSPTGIRPSRRSP